MDGEASPTVKGLNLRAVLINTKSVSNFYLANVV